MSWKESDRVSQCREFLDLAGEIKFHGKSYRFSEVFIDERVGIHPTERDGVWAVFYGRFVIAELDERSGTIRRASRLPEFRCT